MSINLSFAGTENSKSVASDEKATVLRVKYRPPAVQPELNQAVYDASLSTHKKTKTVETDNFNDYSSLREEPVVFLVNHTQVKRVEMYIASDEEAYRRMQYPTIHERIDLQREWVKEQLKDAKMASQREAVKKLADKKLQDAREKDKRKKQEEKKAKQILRGVRQEEKDVQETKHEDEEEEEKDDASLAILEDALQEAEEEMEDEEDDPNGRFAKSKRQEERRKFVEDLMEIKERKLLQSRNTSAFHKKLSKSDCYHRALWFSMGFHHQKLPGGMKNKDITVILPWLLLGRKDLTSNLAVLMQLGITHILNVTNDLPNMFPPHFVYLKIPVKDNIEADIGKYFKRIVAFISRAEKCKGRILVHCTAGSSRAPTAVISYLVIAKKIPLVDAYKYVRTLRPLTNPNNKFLLQLALLEAELGEGVSVNYSPDWRFYEYNLFRGQGLSDRDGLGMFRTVYRLSLPPEDEDDLLSIG